MIPRQQRPAAAIAAVLLVSFATPGSWKSLGSLESSVLEESLPGTWLIDERASDDIGARLLGTPSRGGRRSGWSASGPGVTLPTQDDESWKEDLIRDLAKGLRVLQIEVRGQEISIRNGNSENRILFLDGRTAGDGFGSRTRAQRDGETLLVETETPQGRRVETFELRDEGRTLVVSTEIQGGQLPDARFETVYERIDTPDTAREVEAEPQATVVDPSTAEHAKVVPERAVLVSPGKATKSDPTPIVVAQTPPIRILPLESSGSLASGRVGVETLVLDPQIAAVDFLLDGEAVARSRLPPFDAKISLASPPREQRLEVIAYDANGAAMGRDEVVLNRLDPPFRVRLVSLEKAAAGELARLRAEVSVPREAELEAVVFYRGDRELSRRTEPPFEVEVSTLDGGPADYVRVTATLRDGRQLEDAVLLSAPDFSERVEVQLVQLQVLVTDKSDRPITSLKADDFEILDGGTKRSVERLYLAQDVPLVLGLSVDSSGSMAPIWPSTRAAAELFLDRTLTARDRAFLVDFDSQLRLLQPLTSDKDELRRALNWLQPLGGTALYDSILLSTLQFERQPGRRALVLISDGADSESRTDARRPVELAQRLGIPVYIVALTDRLGALGGQGLGRRSGQGLPGGFSTETVMQSQLSAITGPTGGRLFRISTVEQLQHAFQQIGDELRKQYVLLYYTDRLPAPGRMPVVKVREKGLRVKTVLPLDLAG